MHPKKAPSVSLPLFSSGDLNDGTAAVLELHKKAAICVKCKLASTRKHVVMGDGLMREPRIAFVGEAPGANEDEQGKPFVGVAGKLLTDMLASVGILRADVFICNTVGCRPPDNRVPEEDELKACSPFLVDQLRAVKPKVIVALGATAAKALARMSKPLGEMRGQWLTWEEIPLRVTYHPSYVKRTPAARDLVIDDLNKVLAKLEKLGA